MFKFAKSNSPILTASVLLVDGNNICYKYVGYDDYTLLPEYVSMQIFKAARRYRAEHIIVGFDGGRSAFRSKIYPKYKFGRTEHFSTIEKEHRQEFYDAIAKLKLVLDKYNIMHMEFPGVEFDDIASYITQNYKDIILYSSDHDLLQLNVPQYSPFKTNKRLSLPDCSPKQFIIAKAIAGDSSDNIIGIKGIGIKTAVNILKKYSTDSFGELLGQLDPTKKREQAILDNVDMVKFNLDLVDLFKYNDIILKDYTAEIDAKMNKELK